MSTQYSFLGFMCPSPIRKRHMHTTSTINFNATHIFSYLNFPFSPFLCRWHCPSEGSLVVWRWRCGIVKKETRCFFHKNFFYFFHYISLLEDVSTFASGPPRQKYVLPGSVIFIFLHETRRFNKYLIRSAFILRVPRKMCSQSHQQGLTGGGLSEFSTLQFGT